MWDVGEVDKSVSTFNQFYEASLKGELILLHGGMCRYHLRRDGQVTIYEIVVLPEYQGNGIGRAILEALKAVPGATSIFARCPKMLDSNGWYECMGFTYEGEEEKVYLWRLCLD